MTRPDYTPASSPLRPIFIWAASSTTIFVVLAATVYVVSCWGGR